MANRRLGVAVVGMGWMGDVHSRSYRACAHRYPRLNFEPELVVCADANEQLAQSAKDSHGFLEQTQDWRSAVARSDVDVVSITAPNFLHQEMVETAAAAGKHIWCEKPVGRNAGETAAAAAAVATAKVASMSGFNYRWAPMVQHTAKLIADGNLGEIEMFRGRFYSMFAFDRMGLFSWRFERDKAGNGAIGDLLTHVLDMALELAGPVTQVCGQKSTFIKERPLPRPGKVSHYARGEPGDPTGEVENEDFAGALVRFESGALGVVEGWRSACGPKSDMAFEIYGTNGSVKWTLEDLNALQVFIRGHEHLDGYTRVLGGSRHPDHGVFIPGDGNPIGYEDTKTIECARFIELALEGKVEPSGLGRASEVSDVGAAVLRSCESGKWERVAPTAPAKHV